MLVLALRGCCSICLITHWLQQHGDTARTLSRVYNVIMLVRWGPALRTRRTRLSSAASTVLGPGPGRAARGRAVTHRPHHPTHIPRYRRDCGAGAGTTELTLSADLWQHWVYVVVAGRCWGRGRAQVMGFTTPGHAVDPRPGCCLLLPGDGEKMGPSVSLWALWACCCYCCCYCCCCSRNLGH